MKHLFSAIIAVILSVNVFAAGDYFPIKQGNAWMFTYKKNLGSWLSWWADSGTIRWEIVSIVMATSYPGRMTATVLQTKNLCRRTYSPGGWAPGDTAGYDSVFIPFRVTKDTILIKGLDPGNGLTVNADTCWSFVHDPKGTIPTGMLIVRDTTVSCLGRSLSASIIDPSPCASQLADQSYFITAPDLGPVEYHMTSSPYIVDAFWSEQWKLVWTNLNPVVGGPCAYSKYIGTAVITAAKRPDTLTNAYDVSFRFFTTNTIQEQWAVPSIGQEKDISAIAGIEGNMALFHIKPGNSYACTLDVISAGTCTPLIYHLKPPSPTDNIDTSSMWIMPDSVVENTPSNLNLLSYYFTCNTQFSDKLFTQTAGGIRFTYKAVENPAAGICAPSAKLYGTLFAASALTTGKYPVYSLWIPACYPLCDVAVSPRLVDTLTVVKALSIDAHGNHAHAGVSTIRIFHNNNRTVVEGLITRPGKITISFFRTTGALLGRYESADLSAGWQRIVVMDEAVSAKARAKGVVVIKVDMPGGTTVRQLMR